MARQARFLPFGLAVLFALLAGGRGDARGAAEVIESFGCSPRKGLILLPVTLGDKTYDFALDTARRNPCSITD